MKNGRLLLEELKRATNNYGQRQCILQDSDFKLFKGSLEDRLLSVKRYYTGEKGFSVMEEVTLGIVKGIANECPQKCSKTLRTLLRDQISNSSV